MFTATLKDGRKYTINPSGVYGCLKDEGWDTCSVCGPQRRSDCSEANEQYRRSIQVPHNDNCTPVMAKLPPMERGK